MPNMQGPVIVAPGPEHDIKCAIQKCDKKDYDISKTKAGAQMPPGSRCSALGTLKHTCVKETLQKGSPSCQCEQTFDMSANPPAPVPSSPGKGLGCRPDVVVGGPPPAAYDVYDAKFPCSDTVKSGSAKSSGPLPSAAKTGASYESATSKERTRHPIIANGGKSKTVAPVDCENEPCD